MEAGIPIAYDDLQKCGQEFVANLEGLTEVEKKTLEKKISELEKKNDGRFSNSNLIDYFAAAAAGMDPW